MSSFRYLGFPKASAGPTVYKLQLNNITIRAVNDESLNIQQTAFLLINKLLPLSIAVSSLVSMYS